MFFDSMAVSSLSRVYEALGMRAVEVPVVGIAAAASIYLS
jgi:hypothetical protein